MEKQNAKKTKKGLIWAVLILISFGTLYPSFSEVIAATTTPATINYQGRLLSSSNVPLTGAYSFRFSIWSDADWDAGDTTGGGAINTLAPGYASWQETHSVTVGSFGLFNIDLGSITTLPNFNATSHPFLQVEVKLTANPDTSYEVLDPAGTLADTTDRKKIQNQAYAVNADYLDNAEVGTGAGNIALLGPGGVWNTSTIPAGTNADTFTIDNNNDAAGNITLEFGDTLAKTLSYVPGSSWFEFNDDVNITGNLTTTGTINGVNLSSISFSNMATRAKELVFSAEYPNYSVKADGSANSGTLATEFEDLGGTSKRNFYEWRTSKVAIQDIDIMVSVQLPLDFVSFTGTPLNFTYQTSDGVITTNKLDVSMYDTTGTAVGLTGGTSLASSTWSNAAITFTGTPTLTAGDTITFRIKVSSTNAGFARASDLVLNYNGR